MVSEKMGTKFISSKKFKGVRYREHATRKHGVKKDRYYVIRYQFDGERKEEALGWASKGGWTESKAALKLAELKQAARLGEGETRISEKRAEAERKENEREALRLKKENLTFGEFFESRYYPISQINKDRQSHQKEHGHFHNWLKPVIGNLPFKKIYPLHLERIKKNMLDAEKAPRTIQYCFATCRQVWNQARRDGIVNSDSPTKSVKLPKVKNRRMRYLTRTEAAELLETLGQHSKPLHDMSLLSLDCGLRADEIFSLKWNRINFETGEIYVRDSKGEDRIAFMTQRVKSTLYNYQHKQPEALIFLNQKGKKINSISNTFGRVVEKLGLNAGVNDRRQKVVFHSLRHSFASWHVIAGTDLYVLKKLMGHSSIQLTERYSHLAPETLRSAVKKLDALAENNVITMRKFDHETING